MVNDGDVGDQLHIVMFPFLGFGHINPFIQLARKLTAADSNIRVTLLSAPDNVSRTTSLLPRSDRVSVLSIPLPAVPGLSPGVESTANLAPAQAELLKLAIDAMKPDIHEFLSRSRPHFIVFDFAMPWVPSIAAPLGVKSLFFAVFAAISDAYLMVPSRCLPGPSPAINPSIEDIKKPPPGFPATSAIAMAGGIPTYQAHNFCYVYRTFSNKSPSVYDRYLACMTSCDAIISRTCMEMEGQYISYIESEFKNPMLLAGPAVHRPPSGEVLEERWSKWLDKFEEESVIYCSFGSEAFLTEQEATELVLGLAMTDQPFFVALNCLKGEDAVRKKLSQVLDDNNIRGVVHFGWVQQQLILQHKSVGCFVTHNGLSSIIEGLTAGCQLVMLPQRGDQYLNAWLFAGDLGIGAEVRRGSATGDFEREGVCETVKKVMVKGTESRENHKKWMEFLMDKEVEQRITRELILKLKALY